MLNVVQFAAEGRFHCSASLMTQNHKNRGVQVGPGVLQASHDLARDDIAGHSHNEQLPKVRIENQFRWNAGIAATQNRGIRPLFSCQISKGLFAHGRKSGLTAKKAFVPVDQPLQCLFRGDGWLFHAPDTIAGAAAPSAGFAGACFGTGAQTSIWVPWCGSERTWKRAPIRRAFSSMVNMPIPCLPAESLTLKPAPSSEIER